RTDGEAAVATSEQRAGESRLRVDDVELAVAVDVAGRKRDRLIEADAADQPQRAVAIAEEVLQPVGVHADRIEMPVAIDVVGGDSGGLRSGRCRGRQRHELSALVQEGGDVAVSIARDQQIDIAVAIQIPARHGPGRHLRTGEYLSVSEAAAG